MFLKEKEFNFRCPTGKECCESSLNCCDAAANSSSEVTSVKPNPLFYGLCKNFHFLTTNISTY